MLLLPRIIERFERVIEATDLGRSQRFQKAMTRHRLEEVPEGARDAVYRVEAGKAANPRLWGAMGRAVRRSVPMLVQLSYSRGGGDAGGADRGGSRLQVNRRAANDIAALTDALEDPATYDSDVTGLRVVTFAGFRKAADLDRSEVWNLEMDTEWESDVEVAA